MSGRELTVELRRFEEHGNLFVRLAPEVARDLLDKAIPAATDGSDPLDAERSKGWIGRITNAVDFLPVELSFEEEIVYASYNGGSPSAQRGDHILELPDCLLPKAAHRSMVRVRALPFIQDVHQVTVEPLTPHDWELLELHSDFLESGGFLRQVSVLYPNQVLQLAVGASDVAKFQVVEPNSTSPFRLVATTEVVVVPKPRKQLPTPSRELRVLPTMDALSPKMKDFINQGGGLAIPSVGRGDLMISLETLDSSVPGWDRDDDDLTHAMLWNHEGGETVVLLRVVPSHNVADGFVAIHTLECLQLKASPLYGKVHVKLVRRSQLESIALDTKARIDNGDLHYNVAMSSVTPAPRLSFQNADMIPHEPERRAAFFTEGAIISADFDETGSAELHQISFLHHELSTTVDHDLDNRLLPQFICCSNQLPASTSFSRSGSSKGLSNVSKLLTMLNALPPTPHVALLSREQLIRKVGCVAVVGKAGSGKTHQSQIIAAMERFVCNRPSFYLDCRALCSGSGADAKMSTILHTLTSWFRKAAKSAPSALVLDEFETLCPSFFLHDEEEEEGPTRENERGNFHMMEEAYLVSSHVEALAQESLARGVKLIITSESRPVGRSTFFGSTLVDVVSMPSYTPVHRSAIFNEMLKPNCPISSDVIAHIGSKMESFRPKDLLFLSSRIKHLILTEDDVPQLSQLEAVLADFTPLSKQGVVIDENDQALVPWDEIGGLFEAKERLREVIINPIKFRRIYERAPLKASKAVLLFGPPGSGKSLLGPALADLCGLTLITCRGPELLDRYIGASEAKVRQLFERAEAASPSLLFLDEFDALAPRRGSDNTGVTDRVVNQLLTYLDGVEGRNDSLYIVAATSRPDKIDAALLRPGRLEKHIYVGPPSSKEEWIDVGTKIVARYCLNAEAAELIGSGSFVNVGNLLNDYWSPADLKAAFETAYLASVHERLRLQEDDPIKPEVTPEILVSSLKETRPSLSKRDKAHFDQLNQPFLGVPGRRKRETKSQLKIAAMKFIPSIAFLLVSICCADAFVVLSPRISKSVASGAAVVFSRSSLDDDDDGGASAAEPLELSMSDIERLSSLRNRRKTIPLLILDATLPGQRLEFSARDIRIRKLAESLKQDRLVGMVGFDPATGDPLNAGVTCKVMKLDIQDKVCTIGIEGKERFEVEGVPRLDETKSYYVADVEIIEDREEPPLTPPQMEEVKQYFEEIPQLVKDWLDVLYESKRATPESMVPRMPGPMPDRLRERAIWAGALVNPIPALGVCLEIRPSMLACQNDLARIRLAHASLKGSIDHISGKSPLF